VKICDQCYLGSSSWIRRGGPLLAVVEQFDFLINGIYRIKYITLISNCPTIAFGSGPPPSYPRRGARIVPVVIHQNLQIFFY